VVVAQRDPAWALASVGAAKVRHEDAPGSAMHGVRTGVAGLGGQLLGLDRANELWAPRVGLGIEHICTRRAQARNDQIATLEHTLMTLMTQRAGAGIPAKVMQLIARCRQLRPADHLAVGRRLGVAVDHRHGVALRAGGIERRYIRELLW